MQFILTNKVMRDSIKSDIQESIKVKNDLIEKSIDDIEKAAKLIIRCVLNGGKVLWCGNGGSAADAQHLSTEFMGGMTDHNRRPIPSIALTTDTSFITAWSNDTDFESVFSRQIQGIGLEGDVLVAISTSGKSPNVISAIKQAKYKRINTILFTGNSGSLSTEMSDVVVGVPSNNTQRIQESHIMIGQIICGLVENGISNEYDD
jgi:D-sedoheptulose 7-phosphate isomerase